MDGIHPDLKLLINYLTRPQLSYAALGQELQISKQAVAKKIHKAKNFLGNYDKKPEPRPEDPRIAILQSENQRLKTLVAKLRRQLILSATLIAILTWFKERVLKFFPKMQSKRLEAWQKKYILDMCAKFQRAGGTLKEFCKAIGKSADTITRWQRAYEKHGMSGLVDKKTTPHHFSRRIPVWLKEQLLLLFIRHPRWTPYQYYKYIRDNPSINYSLSLSTIEKMKRVHTEKSQAEKERIKKRWAFAENFSAWTVDYTTLLKTDRYSLQLLTVSDQRSRFMFESALFLDTSTETLMEHLEELFVKYGKPNLIKADNGPEMRMGLRENLKELCVHLLNSPNYYGQFNGAHERIHRELKAYIDQFSKHHNLTKLTKQLASFQNDHNHQWTYECLDNKTPAEIYYSDENFVANDVEVVKPYVKDGELRMKFTNRNARPARVGMPKIDNQQSTT